MEVIGTIYSPCRDQKTFKLLANKTSKSFYPQGTFRIYLLDPLRGIGDWQRQNWNYYAS
jgi:hypothetical protein